MTLGPRTALLVVDMQNDFVDPDGSLEVAGAEAIIPFVNDRIAEAVHSGSAVVYTQDWHPSSTPHFEKDGGVWPVHCVGGSWGAEIHPLLTVVEDAPVVRKGTGGEDGYSGFSVRDPEDPDKTMPTVLHAILSDRDINRVVIVGVATDYCVKETAIDGARLGYETVVLSDGIRAVDLNEGDGNAAIGAMGEAGVTVL